MSEGAFILRASLSRVAVFGAALALGSCEGGMLDSFFPVGEVKPVDFATLEFSGKPNQYLLCPADLCAATLHAELPVFAVPAIRLAEA